MKFIKNWLMNKRRRRISILKISKIKIKSVLIGLLKEKERVNDY